MINSSPPATSWDMSTVTGTLNDQTMTVGAMLNTVLGWASWICLVFSGLAIIGLAALMAIDKERGRAISATSPHVEFLKIAFGVMIISSAGALGSYFYSSL